MQDDLHTESAAADSDVLSDVADFRTRQSIHLGKDSQWWSVLIEIEGSIDEFISNATSLGARTRVPNGPSIPDNDVDYLIPVAYNEMDRADDKSVQPVSIFARQAFEQKLNTRPTPGHSANKWHVATLVLGATIEQDMLDFEAQWPSSTPHPHLSKDATVMAVIDDGIAIAHNLFRDGHVSSRVAYAALLESLPLEQGGRTTVGRDLNKPEIDALLESCTFGGFLDEDLFYARTGQVDFYQQLFSTVALRSSHGTHVMGLAAGEDMSKPDAERPIICAALPSRLVEDTSGLELLPSLYLSFQKLVNQARRFRTKDRAFAPVLFNLSYGNFGGPHDGTGLFARLFEHYFGPEATKQAGAQRAWLTLPSGNGNLSQMHGVAEPDYKETVLDLQILPDDLTTSEVQIWMPFEAGTLSDPSEVEVISPLGQSRIVQTRRRTKKQFENLDGQKIADLTYSFVGGTTQRGLANLFIRPTASLRSGDPLAISGNWKIKIRPSKNTKHPIEAWIRRDETVHGLSSGGKQAFFDNPGYERFGKFDAPLATDPPNSDCPVRRASTMSGFACGETPVVVAAYMSRTEELSVYSASGPCNHPSFSYGSERNGPDLTTKGDESVMERGVLSAGSRSGTLVRRSGTSAAAPRMARAAGIAIHNFPGTGREWAADPVPFTPGLNRIDPQGPQDPLRSGSGLYCYPVALGARKQQD